MKIEILSMHRVYNYGSFLQAYGLKKMLLNFVDEVEFIDLVKGIQLPENLVKTMKHEYSNNKKIDKYILRNIMSIFKDKKMSKIYKEYQNKYLNVGELHRTTPETDTVVIGSDEIFNCLQDSSWGYSNQVFGNLKAQNIFSYAASCGFTTYEDLNEELVDDIKSALKNMSNLSVRDMNTMTFLEKLGCQNITKSLDPVFIADFEDELSKDENKFKLKEKFLLVYSYKNRIHRKEEIDKIRDFARRNNLKIIAVGGYQKWADEYLILNPFQVLNVFKQADFIITDTFHGSIFSMKYNLNYITILRESNKNKLLDLFKTTTQEDRLVSSFENLNELFSEPIDWDITNETILKERQYSYTYLKNSLFKQGENNEGTY